MTARFPFAANADPKALLFWAQQLVRSLDDRFNYLWGKAQIRGEINWLPSYIKSDLPSPDISATTAVPLIFVTDASGSKMCYSNGTNWLRVATDTTVD